jgi:phosphatidylserine/phosphatidylglycerophosphate/cardiolipin synthase-like enzyme
MYKCPVTGQGIYTINMTEYIKDREVYEKLMAKHVPRARRFLWIGTADIKDLYVKKGARAVPFLEVVSDLLKRGTSVRLLHAKEPGPQFRKDFDRYPALINKLERMHCPRVHFKCIVVDGQIAYTGSANMTGAGMGMKSKDKRNFEGGVMSDEPKMVKAIMHHFDSVWIAHHCKTCQRKEYCSEYRDIMK